LTAATTSRYPADKNNLHVGDTLTLDLREMGKSDWQIVGIYPVIFNAQGFSTDSMYAPQSAVFSATKRYNQGDTLVVRASTHDPAYVKALTDVIKSSLEEQGIKLGQTYTETEMHNLGTAQFGLIIGMILTLAVIVAVVGGIGLIGALSISVVERTKEIGVLRAIGTRSRIIRGMFMMEGVMQGVLSWAISVHLALLVSKPLSELMGQASLNMPLNFQYDYQAFLIWLGAVVIISLFASALPARNATRISVRDSLAYA
jgi:putative ABC transport system permease protein